MSDSRLVSAARVDEDAQYEAGLRPRALDDYIGQDRVRENLQVSIAAAAERGEALDHVLLYGPPGLGKTTLAYVIANELGVPIRTTAGPVLEKPGDLAAILTNLQPREVLFIDEIHRMAPAIEEILYPAMEDYELDIVIGQGPSARSVKVPRAEVHAGRRDDARRAAHLAAARALRHRAPARFLHRHRHRGDRPALGTDSGRADRRRCGARAGAALPRDTARREPAAPAGPGLRAGARRRAHHDRRGPRGADAARGGRAWASTRSIGGCC